MTVERMKELAKKKQPVFTKGLEFHFKEEYQLNDGESIFWDAGRTVKLYRNALTTELDYSDAEILLEEQKK